MPQACLVSAATLQLAVDQACAKATQAVECFSLHVAGASRAIGQAIAETMAGEGANLILLAQREGALKEVYMPWQLLHNRLQWGYMTARQTLAA